MKVYASFGLIIDPILVLHLSMYIHVLQRRYMHTVNAQETHSVGFRQRRLYAGKKLMNNQSSFSAIRHPRKRLNFLYLCIPVRIFFRLNLEITFQTGYNDSLALLYHSCIYDKSF